MSIVLLIFMAIANQASACTPNCQVPDSFYNDVIPWSPQEMRDSLHELIDDHIRFPYTSTEVDTWNVLEEADWAEAPESTDIITIYRNARYPKQGGGNNFYNREHTWAQVLRLPGQWA